MATDDLSYKKLIKGYHTFKETYLADNHNKVAELAIKGQKPHTMIIACSDSRIDTSLLLNADLGELFVVRNVANIVPPYNPEAYQGTSAALEFGITGLKVSHLILLGHSQCGGIDHFVHNYQDEESAVGKWVRTISASLSRAEGVDACAQEGVLVSLQHCRTYPWIISSLTSNTLQIHAWFLELEKGTLSAFNPQSSSFEPL